MDYLSINSLRIIHTGTEAKYIIKLVLKRKHLFYYQTFFKNIFLNHFLVEINYPIND